MKDCVVLAGDARDAAAAAEWANACARRARMTGAEAKAVAARVREHYVVACEALFGGENNARRVILSARFDKGAPEFQLCTDGAVKCDALGPKCDEGACDGLTCFRLAA